jgi:DNA-binding transcriptional ArsR family regulator
VAKQTALKAGQGAQRKGRAAETNLRAVPHSGARASSAAVEPDPTELDKLIHERLRLGIVSALAVNESLTFNELKAVLKTSDGNLSVHARKLEEAAYVTCEKFFDGRTPKTVYRLADAGRCALTNYLDHMEAIIRRTRDT